jgi:hypothetical protein
VVGQSQIGEIVREMRGFAGGLHRNYCLLHPNRREPQSSFDVKKQHDCPSISAFMIVTKEAK